MHFHLTFDFPYLRFGFSTIVGDTRRWHPRLETRIKTIRFWKRKNRDSIACRILKKIIFLPSKGTREQYLRLCVQSSKVSVDKQLYNQNYKSTMCYYSWHEVKVNVVVVLIWGKINIKIKRCLLKYLPIFRTWHD